MGRHWCAPGGGGNAPYNPTCPLPTGTGKTNATTYRFQEGDATDGTSCEPSGPCKSTRQFPSSENTTQHNEDGYEKCTNTKKEERPYHKTIPIVFASRLLQVGDNEGPNADDVGNHVDQMGHTQIVGQDGSVQSGTGGHPIPRLSALQPIDDEFRHSQPVQTPKHI